MATLQGLNQHESTNWKLAFAYQTIATLEARIAELESQQPAPGAVLDERAEFVMWVRREWPQAPLSNVRDLLPKDDPRYGEYCDETLQRAWVGWQARACLDKVKELNQ